MNYEVRIKTATDLIDKLKEQGFLTINLKLDIIDYIVRGELTPTRTIFTSFYIDRLDVVTGLLDDLKENGVFTHLMKMCIIEHIIKS